MQPELSDGLDNTVCNFLFVWLPNYLAHISTQKGWDGWKAQKQKPLNFTCVKFTNFKAILGKSILKNKFYCIV